MRVAVDLGIRAKEKRSFLTNDDFCLENGDLTKFKWKKNILWREVERCYQLEGRDP